MIQELNKVLFCKLLFVVKICRLKTFLKKHFPVFSGHSHWVKNAYNTDHSHFLYKSEYEPRYEYFVHHMDKNNGIALHTQYAGTV